MNGIKIGGLLGVVAVFSLATLFIFAPPVFAATYTESSGCTITICINGCTNYPVGGSKSFFDEASCKTYFDGVKSACAGYNYSVNQECTLSCGADEWVLNGACATKNQWCQATYGPNIHEENEKCNCDSGYTFLNNACVTNDQACQAQYGAYIHRQGDLCVCDSGYTSSNGRCISEDEWCRATYGNAHAENGKCPCDSDYWFLKDTCVTPNQWCSGTYGGNSHEENGQCTSESQSVQQGQASLQPPSIVQPPTVQPSTAQPAKPSSPQTTNIKKTPAPQKTTTLPAKKPSPQQPTNDVDEIQKAAVLHSFKAAKQLDPAQAKIKVKSADAALTQAFLDKSIKNPATLENIREMYRDAWLDDPKNKKTNLILGLLEGKRGNYSTADVYKTIAYSGLSEMERDILSEGLNNAKTKIFADISREQEVAKTWEAQKLKESSFVNKLKRDFDDHWGEAQETAKNACNLIKPCNLVYQKKVEAMTKAEEFSQKVSDLMNDPIKTVFGFDRKKAKEELGVK